MTAKRSRRRVKPGNVSHLGELHGIIQQHDDAVDALAEKVRLEVVLPLCRKYRLSFVAIQGNFWFMKSRYTRSRNDWHNAPHYGDSADLDDPPSDGYRGISAAAKAALWPVLDLLNEDIASNNPFGYHVQAVCPVCLKFYGESYKGDCVCDAG